MVELDTRSSDDNGPGKRATQEEEMVHHQRPRSSNDRPLDGGQFWGDCQRRSSRRMGGATVRRHVQEDTAARTVVVNRCLELIEADRLRFDLHVQIYPTHVIDLDPEKRITYDQKHPPKA